MDSTHSLALLLLAQTARLALGVQLTILNAPNATLLLENSSIRTLASFLLLLLLDSALTRAQVR